MSANGPVSARLGPNSASEDPIRSDLQGPAGVALRVRLAVRVAVESFDVTIVAALVLRSDVCLSETPESWLAVLAAVDSP